MSSATIFHITIPHIQRSGEETSVVQIQSAQQNVIN